MAFGHFLLGSHKFMVTALGACVKWPSIVESMALGTYYFTICPKYDMDVYTTTLFGGET